ncbi:MAG: gamma-glutamyltransferase [Myxococcota bacterium]|nr:gamma-glutamyltransferase [Myxococcota bacterium]
MRLQSLALASLLCVLFWIPSAAVAEPVAAVPDWEQLATAWDQLGADPERPPRQGAVAAAHPLAARAGAAMLAGGGSAFDAAVATALVLGVVNPQSSGLGGGGFAVFQQEDGRRSSLDFREQAPSFFSPTTFEAADRDSTRGPWAVGVPGEPAGLAALHRVGGRLPWSVLVEPARQLAHEGFSVGRDLAEALQRNEEAVLADPGLSADLAPAGRVLQEGDLCRRPALAETLSYLQAHGGDAFYRGPLAITFSGFLAQQGLPWTPAELEGYAVKERPVLEGSYRGYGIQTMGPPSSGGIAILQILGMLEHAKQHQAEASGLRATRALVDAMRHAFADRATYGGDPDFVEIPLQALLDPALPARLWKLRPKRGPLPLLAAGLAGERGDSGGLLPDDGGTSHLSVLDEDGNAVALTTTINLHFGAKIADPGTGMVLNDEMDDFSARPGRPNAFGLTQGTNNAVAPGKRPLSSMSPTLVTDGEGRVVLAVGGAGGPRIITGTLQTLLGVLDRDRSPSEAVAAPRVHHQWLPQRILVEKALPAETRKQLRRSGYEVVEGGHRGVIHLVTFDPETGTWGAAADPRANGGVEVRGP